MNTKRCPSCQKMLRVDTQVCSRCGYAYPQPKSSKQIIRPVTPPASPHRTGHYSGLHPEDQPYQSSMMYVPTPTSASTKHVNPEDEFATTPLEDQEPAPITSRQLSQENSVRPWQEPQKIILPAITASPVPATPSQVTVRTPQPLSYAPSSHLPRKPAPQGRTIPILLILSCLFFLVAGSILAYLLVNKRPTAPGTDQLTAFPAALRVNDTFTLTGQNFGSNDQISFTRDVDITVVDGNGHPLQARTDNRGAFAVQIRVPADWSLGTHLLYATNDSSKFTASTQIAVQPSPPGPPRLRLASTSINLGADVPGAVSNKSITLLNTGGGQVSWRASTRQAWLTITPNSGTFSGATAVQLTVNRGVLSPNIYTGTVEFAQQGNNSQTLPLAVQMTVKPAPATAAGNLVLSTVALSYTSTAGQNPPDQSIVLQNTGGAAVDWAASVNTGNGNNWLTVNPSTGILGQNLSTPLAVSPQAQQLPPGSYQATIAFTGGNNLQVNVNLTVIAPANLVASPTPLSFQVVQGQNPPTQTLTLTNNGGMPLDWSVTATTTSPTWLSITPSTGHLDPNVSSTATISANTAALKANSYQGTLTVSYGTAPVRTVTVPVSLTVTTAIISAKPIALSFTTTQGTNPSPQTITLTNTGNAPLNWGLTEDTNGTNDAPATPATGSLAPGKGVPITVAPTVQQLPAQVIVATLLIADTDPHTLVLPQKIAITITINAPPPPQAAISLSTLTTFQHSSSNTQSQQSLTITNTGSATLNWSLAQSTSSTTDWLTFSQTSGTLAPGANISLTVTCDSSALPANTYTTTVTVSDSDHNTSVAPQTVSVTLVVGS